MIDPVAILAIARAEARLTRRLARYWVFVVLSTLLLALGWLQFFFIHRFFSPWSASAAAMNPRFFIGSFGSNYLLVFLIGVVFLGFEVRARDKRERIAEVVDTLPVSNVELIAGRALGIFAAAWIPVAVVALLLAGVGWLTGAPIEPWSLVSFVTLMAPPAYVFTIGLVFVMALVLRNRLVAGLVGVVLLVFTFAGTTWLLPLWAFPLVDVTGGFTMPWPSDIVHRIDPRALLQRSAYLLAGLGLLGLAAALYPRQDVGSRGLRAGLGAAGLLVGLGACGALVFEQRSWVEQRAAWRELHAARANEPAPDVRRLSGRVAFDPGDELSLDLSLAFRAPAAAALERATFSFNPGLAVETVEIGGTPARWTHEAGLLDVELSRPLAGGEEATLRLVARGKLDGSFAYFDSVIEPLMLKAQEAQVFLLGYEPVVFHRRFVALLPGTFWLPLSGAQGGRDEVQDRAADFFALDLLVEGPSDWRIVGPGRGRPAEGGAVRFAPTAPVPCVALVGGELTGRSVEIDGVTFEILVDSDHTANLELFAPAAEEVRDWIAERIEEARELGLDYPYDALTLVEVPNELRGFGGGWRMDTMLAQPGLVLLRETSFPTARFDVRFKDPADFEDEEGGLPRAMREQLETFFEADLNGGNPFFAAARNFYGFQTVGAGPEGMPLDFVWEKLTTKLLTDKASYFSVHMFDPRIGQTFQQASMAMGSPERVSDSFTEVMIHSLTSTPEVWNAILETSLAEMDPWDDPERAINALSLKGSAMADSLLDDLGRTRTATLLAALRERARGEVFDREDVLAAGAAVDADLAEWIDLWIHQTELPGFELGRVSYERIADREDGTPRYQLLVTLINGEEPPGLVKLEYASKDTESERLPDWESTEPARVPGRSAVEIGLVTEKPLTGARVVPYLSRNRERFSIDLPELEEERIARAEPFVGARPVEWSPPAPDVILVDDLDRGFSVENPAGRGLFAGRNQEGRETDQGLPVGSLSRPRSEWVRAETAQAFGRYRHTLALIASGEGEGRASFEAQLPRGGSWELEYYLPRPSPDRERLQPKGRWQLEIVDRAGDRQSVELDAETAEAGWNSLGRFQLPAGDVRVEVSDDTTGNFVVADAVRWTPATPAPAEPAGGLAQDLGG